MKKDDIIKAYDLISNYIVKTPLVYSSFLSEIYSANIYLKLENFQKTGSFKERGALNFLLKHPNLHYVVAASAGNHAQAVAMVSKKLKIENTIFMPISTPFLKVNSTKKLGAKVELVGNNYDESYKAALNFSNQINAQYIHAYDDKDIILGQGTIAIEIEKDLPVCDMILVPVGGGGLISGISLYFLEKPSSFKIIGVRSKNYFQSGKTIAEGIGVKSLGAITGKICEESNVEFCYVDDEEIESGIMLMLEEQKILVEGAAASVVCALSKLPKEKIAGKNIVLVISGGNIDTGLLSKFMPRWLNKSGRLLKFGVVVQDTPGSLAKLLSLITESFANIVDVVHERSFAKVSWNEVLINIITQIKSKEHGIEMIGHLKSQGYKVIEEANVRE